MRPARIARAVVRWTLLVSGFLVALLYLNSAAYNAWASGVPPRTIPAWWLHRAAAHLCYAGVSLATGLAAFLAIRAGRLTRASLVVAALAAGLLATPYVRELWLVDACLDSGGRWNASAFACEK
jgi:hypothetical protein